MTDDVRVSLELAAVLVLAGALFALIASRWLRGFSGSLHAKRRARRAMAGEDGAAELLR